MDRTEIILKLRKKGLSLREIGNVFNVSKQRIQQIIGNTGRIEKIYVDRICEKCGKKYSSKNSGKKYCSRKCFAKTKGKKVAQLDKEGNIICIYDSIIEASRKVNCSFSLLNRASNPKDKYYKTGKGYYWKRL